MLHNDAGVCKIQVNIRSGVRWGAARAYLDPVAERKNLDIVTDALVRKVGEIRQLSFYGVQFQIKFNHRVYISSTLSQIYSRNITLLGYH